MKYIFLIAAFNALFFAALLLQKKPKALHDKVLFYWLVYLGVFTGMYAFSTDALLIGIKHLQVYIISLFLIHGPFLYLYVDSFTSVKEKGSVRVLLHFVPFILFVGYLLLSLAFPEYSDRITMAHVSRHVHPPVIFISFLLLTAFSGPIYFLVTFKRIKKINSNILNNFSATEEINLNWLKMLINIFGLIWSALMLIAIIHHIFHYFSMVFCTDGLFLSLSAFIILVGYYGLRQKEIFSSHTAENHGYITDQRVKYQNMPLSEMESADYISRINRIMDSEKPWLDPMLSLPSLSTMVDIPSYQLSRVINEKYGCNFFDFINGYRVNEVKAKLNDPDFSKLSLLGIALESGFNSKSAFNRIFKKITGITPSEYKKSEQGL